MLLCLGLEAEFVDVIYDLAQVVAALDAVLYLAKDFADLVFDGVRAGGLGFEAVQVGEELAVDEGDEVVAGQGGVVVDLPIGCLGRGPRLPAVRRVEDGGVFPAVEGGFGRLVVFEGVEVFEEEQPGGLLGVVELAGATGVFPEDVVDVFEGLFEHKIRGGLVESIREDGRLAGEFKKTSPPCLTSFPESFILFGSYQQTDENLFCKIRGGEARLVGH